jgi:hypothetical protein
MFLLMVPVLLYLTLPLPHVMQLALLLLPSLPCQALLFIVPLLHKLLAVLLLLSLLWT